MTRQRAFGLAAALLILAGCGNGDPDISGANYSCQANLRHANRHGPIVAEPPVKASGNSVDEANASCTTGLTAAAIAQDKTAAKNGIADTDYVPGCSCDLVVSGQSTRLPTAP